MLKKVLIANRGEIALRIVRACRDLGIESVVAYSDADAGTRAVELADTAVRIGPASARQSYLAIDAIVAAARSCGADSIHPGYGFLSENADLASATQEAGLIFIGPPPAVIRSLGSKLETRRIMGSASVPVLPGSDALDADADVTALADGIGYPLLVKPSGGGGGRGMRRVDRAQDLEQALQASQRECASAFKDSSLYLEKLLETGRHVEVQVVADAHGSVVHVGDRDCSLQRRHQKLVEEAPAPGLSEEQHQRVRSLAVAAAKAAGYVNAGTVEFLFDGESFYVLEVNTRIQVEHCVSEVISGIDLVAEQLRIAAGEPLSFSQGDVSLRGHAVECRLYAEDPRRGFAPSAGQVVAASFPGGPWVREDRGFEVGQAITPYYDGMLSKLIAWGHDRETALRRMRRALGEYRITGLRTNLEMLAWLIDSPAFSSGKVDTGFVEREFRGDLLGEEESAADTSASIATARSAGPPATGTEASPVSIFHYRRERGGQVQDYLIHVVNRGDGRAQAIPLSPRDQKWAAAEWRREGADAETALHSLIEEVLESRQIDEIFPEIGVSY